MQERKRHHHLGRTGQRVRCRTVRASILQLLDGPSARAGHLLWAAAYGAVCWAAMCSPGVSGEYGLATLELVGRAAGSTLLAGIERFAASLDEPQGRGGRIARRALSATGSTSTCAIAVMEEPGRRAVRRSVSSRGGAYRARARAALQLRIFGICGCVRDWEPGHQIPEIEQQIRETVRDRNVFFFVSGGVDSTVAFTLCLRALGPERVRGVYVDTGLMRAGETDAVRKMFAGSGRRRCGRTKLANEFLLALADARDPELKRSIIGEAFRRGAGAHHRNRSICWTGTGFWDREPFTRIRSNPAALRKRR